MGEYVYIALKLSEAYAIHEALELLSKQEFNDTSFTKEKLKAMSEDIRRASNCSIDNTTFTGRLSWKKELLP